MKTSTTSVGFEDRNLCVFRYEHSVTWQHECYQVFMFGNEQDAKVFKDEFGGELMHASERGKGKNWSQWKKKTS